MGTAVLAAAAWTVLALAFQRRANRAFGRRSTFAPATGSPEAGIRYAFLKGMAPQAKESVRTHLGTWATGIVYHAGIATALLALAASLASFALPRALALPAGLGALAGLGLLAKRALSPILRGLSCPDDYLSSLLTSAFTGLAGAHLLGLVPAAALQASAVALFAWIPLGKIRHCLFFFATRVHFGTFFGRRGVLPPTA